MKKKNYKNYHKNPRVITDEQKSKLKKWLLEYGDLSGIVVNNLTGEKICGNQRGDAIDLNKCKIEILKKYEKPNDTGTVAEGYVLFEGVKLNYREVEWDERRSEQANIIANKAGGSWDWQILTEDFVMDDLLAWGFTEEEFAGKDIDSDDIPDYETIGTADDKLMDYLNSEVKTITLSYCKSDYIEVFDYLNKIVSDYELENISQALRQLINDK